ncbi:MAG: hypothetical protein H7A51_11305 [Akkermansiaceae bacterium]|nr:hypothetical protein [Akkermansiaceae bacterium]
MTFRRITTSLLFFSIASPFAHTTQVDGAEKTDSPVSESKQQLLLQLGKNNHRFTPEARLAYLNYRKADAIKALQQHAISLPDPLFDWVDQSPVIASAIYGMEHGTPAQALVLLHSLTLDLGDANVRKYPQLVLAAVMLHARQVDLKNPEALPWISLKKRPPIKVVIPGNPLVRVDTHPKDRPYDIHDHVINFMYETETLNQAGEITKVEPRPKPIRACDIVASKPLQAEFNTYMQRKVKDFQPLHCGESLNWKYKGVSWRLPERKALGRAWQLFSEAYMTKGLLPRNRDPLPSPAEWLAYQISNANDPSRKVELPDAWPFAIYLVNSPQPLREAEYAWLEMARGIRPMRYVEYVGKVAQDATMLRLRRLTPFDYAYGSLAMMRKDGGVCGTHTSTNMQAGAALGMSMMNCASPGHSFPGSLKKANGIYSATVARTGIKWYFDHQNPTSIGNDSNKLVALAAAMNWGLDGFTDSLLGWSLCLELQPHLSAGQRHSLLKSSLMLNPCNISLARATCAATTSPGQALALWLDFQKALESKKGQQGFQHSDRMLSETWKNICKIWEQQPVPGDKQLCAQIYGALAQNPTSSELLTRYQLHVKGLDATLVNVSRELDTHFSSLFRTDEDGRKLLDRLNSTLASIKDPKRPGLKADWLAEQHSRLNNRGLYVTYDQRARKYIAKQDPCALLLHGLAKKPVDNKAWATRMLDQASIELEKHLKSKRTTDICKTMAAKLRAVVAHAKSQQIDLSRYAATWFKMMDGHQAYARHAWCQKDAASVVIDQLVAEFPGDQSAEGLEKVLVTLKKELDALNSKAITAESQKRINSLNLEIDKLSSRIQAQRQQPQQTKPGE